VKLESLFDLIAQLLTVQTAGFILETVDSCCNGALVGKVS